MSVPIHLLFIGKNPDDARLLEKELRSANSQTMFQLEWVNSLEEGLERLGRNSIEAVLLDLNLPGSTVFEPLKHILAHGADMPVIVIADQTDEQIGVNALQVGAQDYLIKGQVDGRLLARSIQYAIQRKQTEAALRESEERFRKVVESAPSAMIVVSNEGRISLANRQAEELFGYNTSEMLGQPIELLVPIIATL